MNLERFREAQEEDYARAYLDDKILGNHLLEITNELLKLPTNNPIEVMGDIDALKLRSSMTLFSYISNNKIFDKVIDKYYGGIKDDQTIMICEKM